MNHYRPVTTAVGGKSGGLFHGMNSKGGSRAQNIRHGVHLQGEPLTLHQQAGANLWGPPPLQRIRCSEGPEVGTRGNQLKAMSNRAGKRERKARNRHKRAVTYCLDPRTCPQWVAVKSGSKHLMGRLERAIIAAVPVADSRSDRKADE